MKDPTYGRIDPDIQRMVEEANPPTLGSRVAMENTLQARRNERWSADSDGPFAMVTPPSQRRRHSFVRALLVTLVVVATFAAMLFAFNSGQDSQCSWWRTHHPGSYEELKYCDH